ncbi:MAG: hypothetical protein AB7I29_14235 [Geobacter sp.]
MTATDELKKAIALVEQAANILQKSQMAFDFTVSNPHKKGASDIWSMGSHPSQTGSASHKQTQINESNLDNSKPQASKYDHHVAYTRTNASGTVSNIAAKGTQTRKEQLGDTTHAIIGKRAINATSLHKINGTHEGATGEYHKDGQAYSAVKHQGNWHLTGDYTQYSPAPKPNATTNHAHYPWGRLTKVDGGGITAILHPEHQEAVGKLQDGESTSFKDEQGIDWKAKRDGEHVKLTPPSIHSSKPLVVKHSDLAPEDNAYDPQPGDDAPLKNPKSRYQSEAHRQLLDGVHKVGNDLLQNPMMEKHHDTIRTMLGELKANPHPKHAAAVASQMKDMVESEKPTAKPTSGLPSDVTDSYTHASTTSADAWDVDKENAYSDKDESEAVQKFHDQAEAALVHSANLHEQAANKVRGNNQHAARNFERNAAHMRKMAEEHGARSHSIWVAQQQAKQVASPGQPAVAPAKPAIPESQVQVGTEQHQFAHGKKPSGRGTWFFSQHAMLDFGKHKEGEDYMQHNGTYSEAKAAAKKWAAAKGHRKIHAQP